MMDTNERYSPTGCSVPALPPEPYLSRRLQPIGIWREAGHAMKVYGIHHQADSQGPIISAATSTAARTALRETLQQFATDERCHGLGFCIVHMGEEAVWLLVDWWTSGGILCQRMLSAPNSQPDAFTPVHAPAMACVWELVVTAHERDAWVRHMLKGEPDASAYIDSVLPAGSY